MMRGVAMCVLGAVKMSRCSGCIADNYYYVRVRYSFSEAFNTLFFFHLFAKAAAVNQYKYSLNNEVCYLLSTLQSPSTIYRITVAVRSRRSICPS